MYRKKNTCLLVILVQQIFYGLPRLPPIGGFCNWKPEPDDNPVLIATKGVVAPCVVVELVAIKLP